MMLDKLRLVDSTLLADVVRKDQRSPDFEIQDWSVQKLSDQGGVNPDGLFRFSGQGSDSKGSRPWSVVLKIVKDPGGNVDPSSNWYWKREVLAYQSGLLADLPGPLLAARGYGVQEYPGEAWIWMEYLTDRLGGRWGLEQFVFAARQLGQFNGACLNNPSFEGIPWMNKNQAQAWAQANCPEGSWDHPLVRKYIPVRTLERIQRLWAEREHVFRLLDSLPAAFSHFDYKRRNLFLRRQVNGSDEVVAVDWAECGVGALGRDLAYVVGSNSFFCETDPGLIKELDANAFEGYVSGLKDAGWQGNTDLVRLGYLAWMSFKWAIIFPGLVRNNLATEESRAGVAHFLHVSAEEVVSTWALLSEYMLDCADEARELEEKLHY